MINSYFLPPHQHICVFKVISPVRSDLPLTSNVPNVQFKPLRLDTFDVKSLVIRQKCTVRLTETHLRTRSSYLSCQFS